MVRARSYPASLGVSYLAFLPRDAMRKCGLCCRPVSVRPSVTFVYCIQMAEDIVKLLSRPGSPIIVVFDSMRRYPIPRGRAGELFQHGVKYTGVHWKNLRFSTEIAVYLGNNTRDTQTMLYGTFIGIRKSYRWQIDPCRFR